MGDIFRESPLYQQEVIEVKEDSRRVGVIGVGAVGKAVLQGMSPWFDCCGYDIVGDYDWNRILDSDMVMICVSTPENGGGRLDSSNLMDVLSRLSKDKFRRLVVIKSTIGVHFLEQTENTFPLLRLVYMPEFLRERSAFQWFVNPDRLVFSGATSDCEEALSFFYWVDEDVPRLIMNHRTAEVAKLAHNAFIATKVSFTNEMENICEDLGADPVGVMSVIWADRRVKSREHLRPHMGPYGGKCVPKDTRELMNASFKTVLLKAVEAVNQNKKEASNGGLSIEQCSSDYSHQESA